MSTSNKKGFLLIEGLLLFQIVIVIVMILSLLVSTLSKQHRQKMKISYIKEEQVLKEIYEESYENER